MCRKFSFVAVAVMFLLFSERFFAGGPPWLCLPIDGVTANNRDACADLLTAKLKSKLWSQPGRDHGIRIRQDKNQSYLTFYLRENVTLRDVEAALQGSGFSVPRDRLRLFGHVILEIDTRTTPSKELLADLKTLDHVSVVKSEVKKDFLLVTVEMPYPVGDNRADGQSVGWDKFQRSDLNSDRTTQSESPATSRMLPSFVVFRDMAAKHKASLKDIHWSTDYACRTVGCVAEPDSNTVISAQRTTRSSPKD